ncbi:TonB-dependent receptor [Croceibacterium aestuarii]|uniref:TonB-dependent receptor n=1 Tax=Croceibacterium aestuarii TaxID=3064139 RepID=UPI00272EE417|nr:TonB-dependent receptor [Croceibacterium sp. D39]
MRGFVAGSRDYNGRTGRGAAAFNGLHPSKWLGGLSALALAAAWAVPAAAQNQDQNPPEDKGEEASPPTDGKGLSEIVVTAQFREVDLQNTPMSITAVNSEQIEQRSITNVVDVAQAAPNVTMTEGGNGFGKTNQAFIRGIGQLDFSFAFEPKVGFYIDDVYYATTFGSVFELLDIDRVEIERGPQGTLNGRNSVGGAIRIFNKKPTGDGSGYVEANYGSYNHYQVKGMFDVPVVGDTVALRLGASYNSRDGWVDLLNFACANPSVAGTLPKVGLDNAGGTGGSRKGCKVGTLGGGDVFTSRGQLRIRGANWDNNIAVDFTRDRSEAPAVTLLPGTLGVSFSDDTLLPDGSGPARPPNTPNGLGVFIGGAWGQYYGLASPLVTGASPATLQNPLSPEAAALLAALNPQDPYVSYAIFGNPGGPSPLQQFMNPNLSTVRSWGVSNNFELDINDSLQLSSITAYRHYTGEFGQSDFALPVREAYNEVAHDQFSQELRLNGTAIDGRLHWTVGGFYLDTSNDNSGRVQTAGFSIFAGPGGTIPFILDMYVDDKSGVKNLSGFVHGDFALNDIFSVEGGLRYTHEKKTYSYFRQDVGQPPSLEGAAPDKTIEQWNPRVSVNAKVSPDVLLYAAFSTGFTAGGNDPRPFFPGDVNLTFGPEKAKAYELGFKSLMLDNRVRFNAAGFWTDYKSIQTFLSANTTGCVPGTQPEGRPPCTIFYYGNGGDATIKGFEAELEARPVPEWLFTAAVGYTDFQYKTLAPGVNPTGDLNSTTLDSPQTQTPKWKITAGTQYDIDLGNSGRLVPHIDATYQSKVYYTTSLINPIPIQPGYTIVNARITWYSPEQTWQVAAYATNLLDKLYYTGITDVRNGFGYAFGQVGRPREFGVSLKRTF